MFYVHKQLEMSWTIMSPLILGLSIMAQLLLETEKN